jgi:protease-4
MTYPQDPATPRPLTALPADPPPPAPPPRPRMSLWGGLFRGAFFMIFLASIALNALILFFIITVGLSDGETALRKRHHSGKRGAVDKIALVRVDGLLMEGLINYAQKQIDEAAEDNNVKAVVLRINSPGGSITASDDLHKRLHDLRFGNPQKKTDPKPLVVSMGSLAASGGYYIAMPAQYLVAERTTITGSIGVYASFPNIADLADKYGFRMETIKAGAVKDSGSMFHHMTPQERKIWQDMVDHAYRQFVGVVEEGRPKLKGKLTKDLVIKEEIPASDDKGNSLMDGNGQPKKVPFTRVRADGGIFTADQAKEFGLIDEIGYQETAIAEAKKLAKLGDDYEVFTYDRPIAFMNLLLGEEKANPHESRIDLRSLSQAATPRLWYLSPQSDLAGLLAAGRSE